METPEENLPKAICKHCGRTIIQYGMGDSAVWVHNSNYIAPCSPWQAIYAEPDEKKQHISNLMEGTGNN